MGPPKDAGLPMGVRVDIDPDVKELAPGVLFGGSPARVLRLSERGMDALADLRHRPVSSPAASVLARRLTDAGVAHPRAVPVADLDVTVVIPVHDRASGLDRCLQAVGTAHPVLVVDDGSADAAAIAEVCARHNARLIRRDVNGGPAAARNTALQAVDSDLIAFLDSDCTPSPRWIETLAGHLVDPLVVAVAPRIVASAAHPHTVAGRYALARSALDLGDRPARVAPMTRVSYAPTAALLVRRAAIADGFDEQLRYGEDVDLVWRLLEAGWRLRYEPSVQVEHSEPESLNALLRRRFHYGTSAAPLNTRHPGKVAPLVLQPWPTSTVAAVLARRPITAGVAFVAGTAMLVRRLRAASIPSSGVAAPMANGVWQTGLGIGRWCSQFAAPAVAAIAVRPGGRSRRTRWGRRAAAAALLLVPPLVEWRRSRPDLDPIRFTAAVLADEAAYGAGVYAGCRRQGSFAAVVPRASLRGLDLD